MIKKGEIHLVDFGSQVTTGYCVAGRHPSLVLKKIDDYKVLVIPFTSKKVNRIHNTEIVFEKGEGNLDHKSKLQCTQFQNVSIDKVKQYIGIIPNDKLNDIDNLFRKVVS